jgi:hypothetical protein
MPEDANADTGSGKSLKSRGVCVPVRLTCIPDLHAYLQRSDAIKPTDKDNFLTATMLFCAYLKTPKLSFFSFSKHITMHHFGILKYVILPLQ